MKVQSLILVAEKSEPWSSSTDSLAKFLLTSEEVIQSFKFIKISNKDENDVVMQARWEKKDCPNYKWSVGIFI